MLWRLVCSNFSGKFANYESQISNNYVDAILHYGQKNTTKKLPEP
jgi:hypothetical protein